MSPGGLFDFLQEEGAPEMTYPGGSPIAQWQIRRGEEKYPSSVSSTNLIQIHGCNASDIDHNLKIVIQLLQLE
jgi:hypothetical protein